MVMWPSAIIQRQKHPSQFLQEEPPAAAAAAAVGVVSQQKQLLCQEDYQGASMAKEHGAGSDSPSDCTYRMLLEQKKMHDETVW